jgi:hypothetical protein
MEKHQTELSVTSMSAGDDYFACKNRISIQTVNLESEDRTLKLKEWASDKSNNFNDSKSCRSISNAIRRRKETALTVNSIRNRAWMDYLFYAGLALVLVTYSMIFGLLYDLCHTLYNPFGPRCLNVPHEVVGGGIRRMAREFLKGYTPPTMETSSIQGPSITVDMGGDEEVVLEEEVVPLYPKIISVFGVQHRQNRKKEFGCDAVDIEFSNS